jgi:hypothetical protein
LFGTLADGGGWRLSGCVHSRASFVDLVWVTATIEEALGDLVVRHVSDGVVFEAEVLHRRNTGRAVLLNSRVRTTSSTECGTECATHDATNGGVETELTHREVVLQAELKVDVLLDDGHPGFNASAQRAFCDCTTDCTRFRASAHGLSTAKASRTRLSACCCACTSAKAHEVERVEGHCCANVSRASRANTALFKEHWEFLVGFAQSFLLRSVFLARALG